MNKVNDIVEDVESQRLTPAELSKLAEEIEEGGDVVRQHEACARLHEECTRQLKCAAHVFRAMRNLSKAGATETQIECIGRKALDGCLSEPDKDA